MQLEGEIAPSEMRTDRYLSDAGQTRVGIKVRGATLSVEIKGLIDLIEDGLQIEPFSSDIQLWAKWISVKIPTPFPAITVEKQRWSRTYAIDDTTTIKLDGSNRTKNGCRTELAKLIVNNETWWTFGLEAFGDRKSLERYLVSTANTLAKQNPPIFPTPALSYPEWLTLIDRTKN